MNLWSKFMSGKPFIVRETTSLFSSVSQMVSNRFVTLLWLAVFTPKFREGLCRRLQLADL